MQRMTTDRPLVSVIIPVYNTERYLEQCIKSIVDQAVDDIEIICVDDGSSDGSLEKLNELGDRYGNIKVISQSNKGAGVARNVGIDHAKGRYYAFLDSDDYYSPDHLRKLVQAIEKNGSDIAVCGSYLYDDRTGELTSGNTLKLKTLTGLTFDPRSIPDRIFNFCRSWAWDKLFDADFIKDNGLRFQDLRSNNDIFFVYSALCSAGSITVVNRKLCYHRINTGDSLQDNISSSFENIFLSRDKLYGYLVERDMFGLYGQSFYDDLINKIYYYLKKLGRTDSYDGYLTYLRRNVFPKYRLFESRSDQVKPEVYDIVKGIALGEDYVRIQTDAQIREIFSKIDQLPAKERNVLMDLLVDRPVARSLVSGKIDTDMDAAKTLYRISAMVSDRNLSEYVRILLESKKRSDHEEAVRIVTGHSGQKWTLPYLARIYRNGLGTDKDLSVASGYYERAIEKGLTWIVPEYCKLLWEMGDETAVGRIVGLASDHDHPLCHVYLGRAYFQGKGTVQDPHRARSEFGSAYSGGITWILPELFDATESVGETDGLKELIAPLQSYASEGDPNCMVRLARAYRYGTGVETDRLLSKAYYEAAISAGMEWVHGEYDSLMESMDGEPGTDDVSRLYLLKLEIEARKQPELLVRELFPLLEKEGSTGSMARITALATEYSAKGNRECTEYLKRSSKGRTPD
ncbi:MAG: glycosyltransferase [archaeon]|nr:glycosyltransferase [archaeon]